MLTHSRKAAVLGAGDRRSLIGRRRSGRRHQPASAWGVGHHGRVPPLVSPVRAVDDDAAAIVAMRDAAARWLLDRGVAQWHPGEVPVIGVREQVAAAEWHVLRDGRGLLAAVRISESDEPIWGVQPSPAVYIHGLMTDRRRAVRGLGASVLRWAESEARPRGRQLVRLDCVEASARLRDFYVAAGYTVVGRRELPRPWHPAVLLEKRLAS